MKLSDFKNDYYVLSGKASDASRQLAFAGVAIIWIFKQGDGIEINIPHQLLLSLAMFTLSLTFDLLQYFYGSITWGIFHRFHEVNKKDDDPELSARPYLNWISLGLFYGKMILTISGYLLIMKYFWENLV